MTDTIDEKIKDDWLADTMVEFSYVVREKELGILPIVADKTDKIFHEEDKIDIETQGLWLFHGFTGRAVPYPYHYKAGEISTDMLLYWARRTIINLEIPSLESYIEELKTSNEEGKDKKKRLYESMLAEAKEELLIVSDRFVAAEV